VAELPLWNVLILRRKEITQLEPMMADQTVRCFGSETDALRAHINDLGFGGYSMDVLQESARFLCFHHRARFQETNIVLRDARLGGLSNPRETARRGGHIRDLHNRIGDECAYAIEERVLTGLSGHDRGVSQGAAARQWMGTIATEHRNKP